MLLGSGKAAAEGAPESGDAAVGEAAAEAEAEGGEAVGEEPAAGEGAEAASLPETQAMDADDA